MQTEKLTKGQKIALDTFLLSFDKNYTFEKLLNAIRVDEDCEAITLWGSVEYMNTEDLADAIENLAVAIDGDVQNKTQE